MKTSKTQTIQLFYLRLIAGTSTLKSINYTKLYPTIWFPLVLVLISSNNRVTKWIYWFPQRDELTTPSSFMRSNCTSRNSNFRERMIEEELANDMNYWLLIVNHRVMILITMANKSLNWLPVNCSYCTLTNERICAALPEKGFPDHDL